MKLSVTELMAMRDEDNKTVTKDGPEHSAHRGTGYSDRFRIRLEHGSFLLMLVLVTLLFLHLLEPFFSAVFWACVIGMLFHPLYVRLVKLWGRPNPAALATLAICLLVGIAPALFVVVSFFQEGAELYQRLQSGDIDFSRYIAQIKQGFPAVHGLLERLHLDLDIFKEHLSNAAIMVSRHIAQNAVQIGQSAMEFVVSLGLTLYVAFFMLRDSHVLLALLIKALPLGDEREKLLFAKFTEVIRATVKGNLTVAAVQGALGGIIFALLGIQGALLWGVVMALLSLIPVIGAGLIWMPVAIYLFAVGDWEHGLILIGFGAGVIGLVDNLLRPVLVGRDTKLPDYIVLLSTLGGLVWFGMNGFVIGPLIAALFVAFWEIFIREFNADFNDDNRAASIDLDDRSSASVNRQRGSWHTLEVETVAAQFATDSITGLTTAEARHRLKLHGENCLTESPPRPLWLKFLDQFKSFLIVVLLLAALLAWFIGDLKDAIVILIVVAFNAGLGFYQEHRAEQTLASLKSMLAPRAKVRRDGQMQEIDAAELVPGDIVLLEAGDRVPADGRLVEAHSLEVQESALTGESQAVAKTYEKLDLDDLPLAEQNNLLFMNTVVTRGRATMIITDTGMRTVMGGLAEMIAQAPDSPSPLQRQLDVLGKRLAVLAGGIVLIIFALTIQRGAPWTDAAMTAIALAVASVPEGLPAVVTVTLSIGMWRMARKRAILKKLASVETLGSTTVICTDKTGTLTLNQMTARSGWYAGQRFDVTGEGYRADGRIESSGDRDWRPFLLPMALCTESSVRDGELIGDPTEGALFVLTQKSGIDPALEQERSPRIAEIPFDSAHKFMATFHRRENVVDMFIKGAPDVLLKHSRFCLGDNGKVPLDDPLLGTIKTEHDRLANSALRVLAVARREVAANEFDPKGDLWRWTEAWEFLGLVGLMDPPRAEAAEAVTHCKTAGIQVKMITGDHKTTATAIANELGLTGDVVTGGELDRMSPNELSRRIDDIAVFARVSPQHKVAILRALKSGGHITAMTGDGVNDAPALKAADIGVAMGVTGTAVTREAATLVLTDDNFATIVHAVEEGRVIYDNIIKFVRFQLSTNIAAILTVLASTLLALPMPFTAIQLLWINIIMDGPPAMTLGIEPARSGLMQEPPRRPGAQILSGGRLLRLVAYGMTMMIGTLSVFTYSLEQGNPEYAVTMAFTTFVLYQFFNVFNARAERETAFNRNFFHNRKLWLALFVVVLLQVLVVHWPPAQKIFGTTALNTVDWLVAILVASSVLVLDETRKWITRCVTKTVSK
ncbi:HAD-IC family P-type ATPase [Methylotuvimicrobium sp. KM2]|uniref:HAD-IC family P-type ATPase n=1 Tax=Methylotuvimicrobium sp. KM2 TaxID=3133976 RepID=UPI00310187BD